jgi:hypothetical protein
LSRSQCGDVLVRILLGKSTTTILSIDRDVNSVDNKISTKLRPLTLTRTARLAGQISQYKDPKRIGIDVLRNL